MKVRVPLQRASFARDSRFCLQLQNRHAKIIARARCLHFFGDPRLAALSLLERSEESRSCRCTLSAAASPLEGAVTRAGKDDRCADSGILSDYQVSTQTPYCYLFSKRPTVPDLTAIGSIISKNLVLPTLLAASAGSRPTIIVRRARPPESYKSKAGRSSAAMLKAARTLPVWSRRVRAAELSGAVPMRTLVRPLVS
jgi:hypothetical protein